MKECVNCEHSRTTGADLRCNKGHTTTYTDETTCPYYEERKSTLQDTLQKLTVKVAPMTPSEAHHEYCRQEQPLKMTDKHDMAQVQSLELVDKWLEQAGNLSLNGVGTYTAWCHLTDSMREYKSAVLLDLYDEDIIDLGGK